FLTDAGNWEAAASLLTPLVATLDSGSSHWYLARVYAGLARVRRAMGELPAAVLAEQTCRRLCDEAGYDLRLIDERCPHPPVTGPVLRCRWFGRLEAILPDGEALIAAGKGTKTLLLLANLHVHAEGLDAKAAALHLFGGSSDPDHAMTVLVARLRQRCQVLSLPPLVQIGGGRLTLGPDWQIDSDYDRFLEARSRSRTATNEAARVLALQAMITLYQGHLFGKLHQEDWSRSAHDVTLRYWQQAHEALQQVCDTEEAWSLALALAETNLAIDPLGFKANRRKLTLLVRMGEPVVAMALWQDLLRRRQHPRVRHLIEALRPVAIELSLEPS
ncbi:MAG: hypothetical protein H7338_16015, partial [Candidatus Sericytochromatia bacterium]|nr:hypothetical protein [Candidatus Sericytochromatia bacterium]